MNADSEQITLDKSLIIAQDQPLLKTGLQNCLKDVLGEENCRIIPVPSRKWVLEYRDGDKVYHILARACTFLGNPHPIYKKRVQFPEWFREYAQAMEINNPEVDLRLIGIYHYADTFHGENVILIDFDKSTYMRRNVNNSSAHVYTNDLFQAMNYGIFRKLDNFGNTVTTVRRDKFREYLSDKEKKPATLFDLFEKFNKGFTFGEWLESIKVIPEMHKDGWPQWRQAEWPGWYLEYRFNKFTIENHVTDKMRYVGSSLKKVDDLDFDIRFEDEDFYGDLKASDVKRKESPGNDKDNLIECILRYDRFWYVIYEHETVKDSERNYEATKERNRYIRTVDPHYDKDDMSYHARMKNSVRFVKMIIIELNRVNFREVLKTFNQGHQPDGSLRKPKFMIDKEIMNNENFVVFRYIYTQ